MCIVHAITKDGPLVVPDPAPGGPVVAGHEFVRSGRGAKMKRRTFPLPNNEFTAEYLFEGKSKGDYHDSMNNQNFSEWVDLQLVPTFEARYPGKKMILILDNAPYHHNIELEPLTGLNKSECVALLLEHSECLDCSPLGAPALTLVVFPVFVRNRSNVDQGAPRRSGPKL